LPGGRVDRSNTRGGRGQKTSTCIHLKYKSTQACLLIAYEYVVYMVVKVWTAASHNRSVLPKLNMARDMHIKWEFLLGIL